MRELRRTVHDAKVRRKQVKKSRLGKRWQRQLTAMVCLYFCAGTISAGYGAAESFKTPEYYAGKGLDLINAADAYKLGYTGKGIVLGICDDFVKFSHPEFAYKSNSGTVLTIPAGYDWFYHNHGTHVGGIMAAAKDNIGMHGVAFDANLQSGAFDDWPDSDNLQLTYNAINQNRDIKIINNSWGTAAYIDEIGKGKAEVLTMLEKEVNIFLETIEYICKKCL